MSSSPPPPSYAPPSTDPLLPSSSSAGGGRHNRHNSDIINTDDDDYYRSLRQRRHHYGRILDRDADFFQSRGRWKGVELLPRASGRRNRSSLSVGVSNSAAIATRGQYHHPSRRTGSTNLCHCCKRRLRQYFPRWWDDWFHTLAYQRTVLLMLVLFCIYFAIVVGFGFLYLAVSVLGAKKTYKADGSYVTESFCDMDINDHMEALYFSLSTMTTIGYGVSDYYFGGCWTPLLLVLMQVCTAITFDACAVGLLFTRLSRGRKRSKTIIVSNQAIVQRVQGMPYFMFRVAELRRVCLIQASVRLYCIRHERIPKWYHSGDYSPTRNANMRGNPTGEAALPPLSESTFSGNENETKDNNPTNFVPQSQPRTSSNPSNTSIPIETTHFITRAMKLLHNTSTHNTASVMDSDYILMSLPQVLVHRMDDSSPLIPPSEWYDAHGCLHHYPANPGNLLDTQAQIIDFWKDRRLEIVVLVEGIDELTGAAIQTRHSYSTSTIMEDADEDGDVVWNHAFVNCIMPCEEEDDNDVVDEEEERMEHPICAVDFAKFHDTHPVPRDCLASPYVPF